jgi:hypothetical protein
MLLQLAIEGYFKSTARLTVAMAYWIGLYRAGKLDWLAAAFVDLSSTCGVGAGSSKPFPPAVYPGTYFYWADKSFAGNGEVSESNPYAHWCAAKACLSHAKRFCWGIDTNSSTSSGWCS